MSHQAAFLPDGRRLHLQHGPIDLVIGCDGADMARRCAFDAAEARFSTVLEELVAELPRLRAPVRADGPRPRGQVARRMDRAVRPFAPEFVTPMAAVAGAVADTVLASMRGAAPIIRGYVNNGGDIALHLAEGERFALAISDHTGHGLGRIAISAGDGISGVATSGRHGRSHSFGIADSVTVLARNAAEADAAATLIANSVDLPGHPAVQRCPASSLDPDSDLGSRPVVIGCGPLIPDEVDRALDAGAAFANRGLSAGRIVAAALFLSGRVRVCGALPVAEARRLAHA